MDDRLSVIVYGLGERASAVARMMLLSGHAVAVHEAKAPTVLRRKMAFSDAWYDGAATLDGVEARRADCDADFLLALRSGTVIPVLTHPLIDVVGRWPWDVVVDARDVFDPIERSGRGSAELTIALGAGPVAGSDCDLVIETGGPDPGAVIRSGCAGPGRSWRRRADAPVVAPVSGVFVACRMIGEVIAAGELIGAVGDMPVVAPVRGRVLGLQRSPRSVRSGDILAELTAQESRKVSGVDPADQLIARSVAFAVELELKWPSLRFENLKW